MEDSLARVEKFAHASVTSLEMKMQQYNEWSPHFDDDVAKLSYRAPLLSVELLSRVKNSMFTFQKTSKAIDFAAGTGLVAISLRQNGFTGEIDAQDGSSGMLDVAKGRGLYSNFYHCMIQPDKRLLLPESHYDVGLLCGALSDSQVHPRSLEMLLRHIKSGGLFVFSTRMNRSNLKYKMSLDAEIQKLVQNGSWKIVKVEEIDKFERATSSEATSSDKATCKTNESPFIPGVVYCCQKL